MRLITINFSITSEKAAREIYKQKMLQAKHLHWIIQHNLCGKNNTISVFHFFNIMVTVSMVIL